ncbi:MAG TPA: hypothetical protein VIE89_36685 [Candidatus Binatia bacterium]|jgi:hypothetical protein
MFIETYYDERVALPATSEPAIPYPELVGEELRVWQRYLPVKTKLGDVPYSLYDNIPQAVIEAVEKAHKAPSLFNRIEIWSRSADPMAVGVITGEQTCYFSIARWGDAKLTIEQVKKRLRLEKWLFMLLPVAMILIFLLGTFVLITYAGQFPDLAQSALAQEELLGY